MALRKVGENYDFFGFTVCTFAGNVMSFSEMAAQIILCRSFTNFSVVVRILNRVSFRGDRNREGSATNMTKFFTFLSPQCRICFISTFWRL
jgi:hypothetical protein